MTLVSRDEGGGGGGGGGVWWAGQIDVVVVVVVVASSKARESHTTRRFARLPLSTERTNERAQTGRRHKQRRIKKTFVLLCGELLTRFVVLELISLAHCNAKRTKKKRVTLWR